MGICEYIPYSYSVYQNLLNVNTFFVVRDLYP